MNNKTIEKLININCTKLKLSKMIIVKKKLHSNQKLRILKKHDKYKLKWKGNWNQMMLITDIEISRWIKWKKEKYEKKSNKKKCWISQNQWINLRNNQ